MDIFNRVRDGNVTPATSTTTEGKGGGEVRRLWGGGGVYVFVCSPPSDSLRASADEKGRQRTKAMNDIANCSGQH